MNIPTEFKGKIYIYWCVKYDYWFFSERELVGDIVADCILLGVTEDLHIQFPDPRAAMVESLKASIEQERAESQRRIAIMQGRIQELLALEVQS